MSREIDVKVHLDRWTTIDLIDGLCERMSDHLEDPEPKYDATLHHMDVEKQKEILNVLRMATHDLWKE